MNKNSALFAFLLALTGISCSADQTPSEFYVSVEQQWCETRSIGEMMDNYYYNDNATRRFVKQFGRRFSNPTYEMEQYCNNYDFENVLKETRTRKVAEGRFAVLGMTISSISDMICTEIREPLWREKKLNDLGTAILETIHDAGQSPLATDNWSNRPSCAGRRR